MKKGGLIFIIALVCLVGLYVLYQAAFVSTKNIPPEVVYPSIEVPEDTEVMLPSNLSKKEPQSHSAPSTTSSLRYVGDSPEQCAVIRFVCEEGEEYFSDDVGCGCKLIR